MLAKFSFVRLRADHIDDMEGLSEAKKDFIRSMYDRPERFINTTQLLIIFFIILLATISSSYILETIHNFGHAQQIENEALKFLMDGAIFLLISLGVLIFGEITPKALGLSFPEKYIRLTVPVVMAVGKVIWPLVALAEGASNLMLKLTGAPYRTEVDLVHSEEEIRMLVNHSHKEGAIDRIESELIDNVFDFVDRMAKEVMIPRQDVDCVFVEDDFETTMKTVRSTSHTRYPLCVEDKDHVIGLVHIKDLMEHRVQAEDDLRNLRRDILVVPEVMKLSTLLQYMRTRRIYQAIVVDEYGGMVGLVGLEDIIEELVGDIQDEHEKELPAIVANEDGSFTFDGKLLLDEVEDTLTIEIDDADEDTIGGYIFGLLERTPVVGDMVRISDYEFTVLEMQGYRIARLLAMPVPPEERDVLEIDE